MKRLACAVLAALAVNAMPARAAESYPLVCKAGNAMNATLRGNGTAIVSFIAAAQAASDAAPGPSQCTWLDRPLNSAEPTRLRSNDRAFSRYLMDAMLNSGSFYVQVFNDGAGNMIVTHVGP
ncbi:MAG TPA: hypothetical protein PKE19_01380 [Aestuariivirga sp.]|nr:hypothetical protein [Aestuariivirga sp.]